MRGGCPPDFIVRGQRHCDDLLRALLVLANGCAKSGMNSRNATASEKDVGMTQGKHAMTSEEKETQKFLRTPTCTCFSGEPIGAALAWLGQSFQNLQLSISTRSTCFSWAHCVILAMGSESGNHERCAGGDVSQTCVGLARAVKTWDRDCSAVSCIGRVHHDDVVPAGVCVWILTRYSLLASAVFRDCL